MKIIIHKLIILILCIPAYPILVVGMYLEANSYLGDKTTLKEVSDDYWTDVKDALIYRRN